jgi:Cytochrome P460
MKTLKPICMAIAVPLVAGSLAAWAQVSGAAPSEGRTDAGAADAQGNLHVPADYRTRYQALGSWAIAADNDPGSKEMHLVYASPGTIDAYRKTGQFPDGAVLVKEVFAAATRGMTTGTASHADVLKGWFVMVKDSRGSHPGNPLWGDGWGWSWFDADMPMKTTSTSFTSDCLPCHVPAQTSDWIYTSDYPALRH